MKKFVITIDTEGDNLWQWNRKSPITTENTKFLARFQKLCEQYGFKPVWLTNFEMINDLRYVDFIIDVEERKAGEIGMHLHAWNTPPLYNLPLVQSGLPFLIEYPKDIMRKKVDTMTSLIEKKTGIRPTTHRAGRWAMDDRYYSILKEFGYTVDCSVTPHINWSKIAPGQTKICGSDYSSKLEMPYWIDQDKTLLEVPVTIRNTKAFIMPDDYSLKNMARTISRCIKGQTMWLRPSGHNRNAMLYYLDMINESDSDYIMFMLHSSEFMPGGSPNFRTERSIDDLFTTIEAVFAKAVTKYEGITLRNYYNCVKQ
jgi:hypothetical protein